MKQDKPLTWREYRVLEKAFIRSRSDNWGITNQYLDVLAHRPSAPPERWWNRLLLWIQA